MSEPADELERLANSTWYSYESRTVFAAAANELRALRAELAEAVEAIKEDMRWCPCKDGYVKEWAGDEGQVSVRCKRCRHTRDLLGVRKAAEENKL